MEATQIRPAGLLLDLAAALQKHLPRGRGAIPRALGKAALRGRQRFLTTRHGAKLVLSPDSLDVYATMRLNGNTWDYLDFTICRNSLLDGQTFYDVGANVGYFVVEMAKISEGKINVVGFEPQTDLVRATEASITVNDLTNARVIDALVGDDDRMAEIFHAASSIHASAVEDSGRNPTHASPKRMVTIDGLVRRGEITAPDFVKIDVEGSEHLVFRGAREVFREHRPNIYLEYLPQDDVGGRVRREVERLAADTGCYDLIGSAQHTRDMGDDYRFFRMASEADWSRIDGVYMRNRARPIRDAAMFGG